MPKRSLILAAAALLAQSSAHAINARYAQQLERSGCTQVTEAQGCDIHKTKAENAKAGFVSAEPGAGATPHPYVGNWVAKAASGATVATIRIDTHERAWIDGKRVKSQRSDGALVFRKGTLTFTLQGDRRLQGQDIWLDSDAGTQGLITAQ